MTKLGITGTRWGWTEPQSRTFAAMIRLNHMRTPIDEFHHGLCDGVDCQSHDVVKMNYPEIKIVGHPPVKTEHMGLVECDVLLEAKTHFARNRDIVDATDGLIVVPYQSEWQDNGGTWYTHDYAKKKGKPIIVIWPDGTTKQA